MGEESLLSKLNWKKTGLVAGVAFSAYVGFHIPQMAHYYELETELYAIGKKVNNSSFNMDDLYDPIWDAIEKNIDGFTAYRIRYGLPEKKRWTEKVSHWVLKMTHEEPLYVHLTTGVEIAKRYLNERSKWLEELDQSPGNLKGGKEI